MPTAGRCWLLQPGEAARKQARHLRGCASARVGWGRDANVLEAGTGSRRGVSHGVAAEEVVW